MEKYGAVAEWNHVGSKWLALHPYLRNIMLSEPNSYKQQNS
jgi:hypothetical protein